VAVFHRILVGVDDSPAARRALGRAIELAIEGHGRIGLLASAPEPPCVIATSPLVPPASRAQLREETEQWAQKCVEAATDVVPQEIPVTKLVSHGDPAAALSREASGGNWDLIVVGETSRRFRPPLCRPVGERLHDASTPVLVVHDEPPAPHEQPADTRRGTPRPAAPVTTKGPAGATS
jgi:nucleotide-binding universal stress UspA family protein